MNYPVYINKDNWEVQCLPLYWPKKKSISVFWMIEYCKPTFIRKQEIFTRTSSLWIFLPLMSLVCLRYCWSQKFISANQIITCKSWNKVIVKKSWFTVILNIKPGYCSLWNGTWSTIFVYSWYASPSRKWLRDTSFHRRSNNFNQSYQFGNSKLFLVHCLKNQMLYSLF